jgi:hypothetical protein
LLFGQADEDFVSPSHAAEIAALGEIVRGRLSAAGFISYVDVADSLGQIPWDVLDALRHLVRSGVAREGVGKQRGHFCLL